MPAPSVAMPQPVPWVRATTPSTFGKRGQRRRIALAREMIGDGAGGSRRAVHAGQDADVVAGGHPAIGPLDAHERGFAPRRIGLDVGAEGVVALEIAHRQVVRVHVLAGRDRPAGEADDLVVAAHRLAGGDRPGGDLVPGRDQALDDHVLGGGAADELGAGDQDVVLGMQADEGSHDKSVEDGSRLGTELKICPARYQKNIFGSHSTSFGM